MELLGSVFLPLSDVMYPVVFTAGNKYSRISSFKRVWETSQGSSDICASDALPPLSSLSA